MLTWFRLLDGAMSAAEVVSVVRDFIASWAPAQLALLPATCRPGPVQSEMDVEALHDCLVAHYREHPGTGEQAEAVQRMTSFMLRAAVRLSQLRGEPGDEPREDAHEDPPANGARSRRP